MAIPFKTIRLARQLVLEGYTVAEISDRLKITKSAIYLYTKAERAKINTLPKQ